MPRAAVQPRVAADRALALFVGALRPFGLDRAIVACALAVADAELPWCVRSMAPLSDPDSLRHQSEGRVNSSHLAMSRKTTTATATATATATRLLLLWGASVWECSREAKHTTDNNVQL